MPEGVALAQPEAAAFIQAQAHAVGAVVEGERPDDGRVVEMDQAAAAAAAVIGAAGGNEVGGAESGGWAGGGGGAAGVGGGAAGVGGGRGGVAAGGRVGDVAAAINALDLDGPATDRDYHQHHRLHHNPQVRMDET